MSLLTMIQNVCLEQGLPRPESVISSTDLTTRQLLAIANRAVREMRTRAVWPSLSKEHAITLVDATASYAMPYDYDRQIHRTHWNRNRKWEILGPMTPQEYQFRVRGIVSTTPRQYFRMSGWAERQFHVVPTPTSSDAGHIISFEYQTVSAVRARPWETGTTFAAGEYASSEGNNYYTILGGVTGATAPVHTSGSVSDGGVTWDFYGSPYDTFRVDTDESVLDENVLGLGVQWRFMQQKGLAYEKIEVEYERALNREITAEIGAKTLSLVSRGAPFLLSSMNIPDTGYGS